MFFGNGIEALESAAMDRGSEARAVVFGVHDGVDNVDRMDWMQAWRSF
jgi:hypothetical protein